MGGSSKSSSKSSQTTTTIDRRVAATDQAQVATDSGRIVNIIESLDAEVIGDALAAITRLGETQSQEAGAVAQAALGTAERAGAEARDLVEAGLLRMIDFGDRSQDRAFGFAKDSQAESLGLVNEALRLAGNTQDLARSAVADAFASERPAGLEGLKDLLKSGTAIAIVLGAVALLKKG